MSGFIKNGGQDATLRADLSAPGGATRVGFQQAGTGSTARTLNLKARETVTPQDFMTDEQRADVLGRAGLVDVTDAIQKALDHLNSLGGGRLHLPAGRYRKADTAPTLVMYSNIVISGDGDASDLFHDDRDTNPRRDLLVANNCNNIAFQDFRISGTALTYPNETNQSQCLTGGVINGLRMSNVTIEKVRYMATAFGNVSDVTVTGCRLDTIVRDGYRFTNSDNVTIVGNTATRVADDVVALHSLDASTVPGAGFVVANNVFEQCQGIKVLGAKALKITGNIMRRSIRAPILVSLPDTGIEGNTAQFAVDISGNTIMDSFGHLGTNYAILVNTATMSKGALSVQPGVNAPPYAYNYTNNLDGAVNVKMPISGVTIDNNTIGRTLPEVAAFADWGYGQLFDRVTVGFWSNPAVTSAAFQTHGIMLNGPSKNVVMSRNHLHGIGTGYSAISLGGGAAALIDYDNLVIESNMFWDCPGVGIAAAYVGNDSRNIAIRNNVFDMDPYFRSAAHSTDNTWTSAGSVVAINNNATAKGFIVDGNTFKNCGNPIANGADLAFMGLNFVYADVSAGGDIAANKGVRFCSTAYGFVYITIDADPTSATFGKVTTMPRSHSSAMPTAGKYVYGHFVRRAAPSVNGGAGVQYSNTGWWRATTGAGHVAGVDWYEMRCPTGT